MVRGGVAVEHHSKFQAVYVLILLTCMIVWRKVGVWVLGRARMKRIQVSEYAVLYLFFLWLLGDSIRRSLPRLFDVWAMDDAYRERLFASAFEPPGGLNRTEILASVSLEPYPLLRLASLGSPIPVLLTWLICLWDTVRHVRLMWHLASGQASANKAHDRAVQIIALPTAFALMSLSAVARVLDVMCNTFSDDVLELDSWEQRRDVTFKFYEAHYQIADLYEAWALFHFGRLALEVVHKRFRSMTIVEMGEDPFGPERDLQGDLVKLATGMHWSVQKLTMQGIWSFVTVCILESLYGIMNPMIQLLLAHMRLDQHKYIYPVLQAMEHGETKVHYMFIGMGLVASSAAIGNIMQVEKVLHRELEEFRPFWKFWGTKVLVSFAFLQQILVRLPIPPFSTMSEAHAKLFYSTALCYECLLVSLLHLHAWNPHELWYNEDGSPLRVELVEQLGRPYHSSPGGSDL